MDTYSFNISLSVLNHLGRNLYVTLYLAMNKAVPSRTTWRRPLMVRQP